MLGLGSGLHLHSLGLVAGLVAELDEGHQHGQAQAPDEDVEDPGHVAQTQGLGRLVLQRPAVGRRAGGTKTQESAQVGASARKLQHLTPKQDNI